MRATYQMIPGYVGLYACTVTADDGATLDRWIGEPVECIDWRQRVYPRVPVYIIDCVTGQERRITTEV